MIPLYNPSRTAKYQGSSAISPNGPPVLPDHYGGSFALWIQST